ncbi:hypothetical protein PoB_007082200 [Plakobranchus ocellatus]|uniref:Uncharacterized protein n=1 Tax=Plakobranchus ocellatus TaxID=259542 RepID=A0AAV4DJU7_9GAST|nr:hypothetical protein PoB_007082200 [Plakobranchus ocellatus]
MQNKLLLLANAGGNFKRPPRLLHTSLNRNMPTTTKRTSLAWTIQVPKKTLQKRSQEGGGGWSTSFSQEVSPRQRAATGHSVTGDKVESEGKHQAAKGKAKLTIRCFQVKTPPSATVRDCRRPDTPEAGIHIRACHHPQCPHLTPRVHNSKTFCPLFRAVCTARTLIFACGDENVDRVLKLSSREAPVWSQYQWFDGQIILGFAATASDNHLKLSCSWPPMIVPDPCPSPTLPGGLSACLASVYSRTASGQCPYSARATSGRLTITTGLARAKTKVKPGENNNSLCCAPEMSNRS